MLGLVLGYPFGILFFHVLYIVKDLSVSFPHIIRGRFSIDLYYTLFPNPMHSLKICCTMCCHHQLQHQMLYKSSLIRHPSLHMRCHHQHHHQLYIQIVIHSSFRLPRSQYLVINIMSMSVFHIPCNLALNSTIEQQTNVIISPNRPR